MRTAFAEKIRIKLESEKKKKDFDKRLDKERKERIKKAHRYNAKYADIINQGLAIAVDDDDAMDFDFSVEPMSAKELLEIRR